MSAYTAAAALINLVVDGIDLPYPEYNPRLSGTWSSRHTSVKEDDTPVQEVAFWSLSLKQRVQRLKHVRST